jgi:uncharacterized membrane protein YfcA
MSVSALILLGISVGAFGTLIGAGGGFILVPILLIIYPGRPPELITAISLAVVCLNASSGSIAYAFKKRIDYKSALIFCIATLPGTVIGSLLTSHIPRNMFNLVFGVILIAISTILIIRPARSPETGRLMASEYLIPMLRSLRDKQGRHYEYRYDLITAGIISFFVGIASSMLGIGGGIIHVPAMVNLLNFPVHIATATSHFVLALMGLSGSVVHGLNGDLQPGIYEIIFLGIGAMAGAPAGAALSHRMNETVIIRSLAIALLLVAIRVIWMGIAGYFL